MGTNEPDWLRTIGDIAGTLLLLELIVILLVVCVLTITLAVAAWWVHNHARPVLDIASERAIQALNVATTGSDRVVSGIAEFHGRRQQLETALRILLFGRRAIQPASRPPEAVTGPAAASVGNSPLAGFGPGELPPPE